MPPTVSQHLLRSIDHCTPNSEHDGNTEFAPEAQRPNPAFLLLLRILDTLLYHRFCQGLVSCDFDIRHQNHQISPFQSRRLLAGVAEEKQCSCCKDLLSGPQILPTIASSSCLSQSQPALCASPTCLCLAPGPKNKPSTHQLNFPNLFQLLRQMFTISRRASAIGSHRSFQTQHV